MVSLRRAYQRVIALWRYYVLVLVVAPAALLIRDGNFFDLVLFAFLLIFIASQFFWMGRVLELGERFIPGEPHRGRLVATGSLLYLFVFIYSFPEWGLGHSIRTSDYRLGSMVVAAVFWWWFVGSMSAFLLVMVFGILDRTARFAAWIYSRAREAMPGRGPAPAREPLAPDPPLPGRRRFLERSAVLVSAAPFVAAGYGLLYGRKDVEVVQQRIRLARLPKAFEGFRIAQLSDIHFGPFTTAEYVRRCVTLSNGLKPDLVVLTGDYISWDPEGQGGVVQALAGLRAPHGVFGCLGNHEAETGTEDSTTRLFAERRIRMLRQERAEIRVSGEMMNLIGIDEAQGQSHAEWVRNFHRRVEQVKGLVMPDTVNILLVHYAAIFDYVSGLDVDLTLAGHTHGGQLSLDFVYRGLNLSHVLNRYDSGRYEKAGSQLYVNRGIGTTGPPIRFGARPEITIIELTRQV